MTIPTLDEMDDAIEGLLELFEEEDSESLADLIKASFGGDRSAAGRYAANIRWGRSKGQEQVKKPREYSMMSDDEHTLYLKQSMERQQKLADDDNLPPDESKSLGLWGTSSHSQINQVLRGQDVELRNWVPETLTPEDAADALQRAFSKVAIELKADTTVFRGVAYDRELPYMEEGLDVSDDGFVAASINPSYARSYGDGSDVDAFMEIRIPKGTKVWFPKTAYVNEEREITLPPKTKMRLVEAYEDEDKYGTVRKYVMEVVDE